MTHDSFSHHQSSCMIIISSSNVMNQDKPSRCPFINLYNLNEDNWPRWPFIKWPRWPRRTSQQSQLWRSSVLELRSRSDSLNSQRSWFYGVFNKFSEFESSHLCIDNPTQIWTFQDWAAETRFRCCQHVCCEVSILQHFRGLNKLPCTWYLKHLSCYVVATFGVSSFIISLSEAQASMNSPDSKQKLMQM